LTLNNNKYTIKTIKKSEIYIKNNLKSNLKNIKGVVFDCDGVLIDARLSYDLAIKNTISLILGNFISKKLDSNIIPNQIIEKLRETGGFNNDCDTVYAIIIYILNNLDSKLTIFTKIVNEIGFDKLKLDKKFLKVNGGIEISTFILLKKLREEIFPKFIKQLQTLNELNIQTLKKSLLNEFGNEGNKIIKSLDKYTGYNKNIKNNIITTIFDEFFYGKKLFNIKHNKISQFTSTNGLIKNEKSIITHKSLETLEKMFTKENLGIVSGRSLISAKFTLKSLMNYFNKKALIFIEDEELKYKSKQLAAKIWKPNPYSLLKALNKLNTDNNILYVGNSSEDYIMTEAVKLKKNVFFVGVYDSNNTPEETKKYYLKNEIDIIVPNVNYLIDLLREEEK
jgi:phosphoglycolate phosphatase-like HAD superfamily hydrolase|tara:strand:- start:25 stop:1206 length:1182 start_codon:yes stop_codon:yes gene_type:complete